jgi:Ion transport protein
MTKYSKIRNIFEYFIMIAIVLVIVQTFLDEFSRYSHWSVQARNILLFSGLAFDFIFSVEFTLRTIWSRREKGFFHYLIHERGWIDFLSSYPLLLLDSGPSAYLLFFGHLHQSPSALEVINIFKVIKAIRVTRILRLIRIVKIFGKIHNADSKMAQHHTAEISTIGVFTVICVLLGFAIFNITSGFNLTSLRNTEYTTTLNSVMDLSKKLNESVDPVLSVFSKDPNTLMIYNNKELVHHKLDSELFEKLYDSEDYSVISSGKYSLYISHIDITKQIAFEHIQSFFIIIFLVLAYMIIYTRHFVQKISDVIHIMDKGFKKNDYNLQVKIKDEYAEHEIFELAKFYNDRYLPAKLRRMEKKNQIKKTGLSMNDILNFNAPEEKK